MILCSFAEVGAIVLLTLLAEEPNPRKEHRGLVESCEKRRVMRGVRPLRTNIRVFRPIDPIF